LQGNAGTVTNSSVNQAAFIIGADNGGFNWGGVIKQEAGAGAMSFLKSSPQQYNFLNESTHSGATVFAGGVNLLADGGRLTNTSSIAVNYAYLQLNDNVIFALANRVNTSADITLRGGSLVYQGRIQTETSQSVGNVILAEGYNMIQAANGGTGINSATLNILSLIRPVGSTATLRFPDNGLGAIGSNGRIIIPTFNFNGTDVSTSTVGAGLTNNLIGPWAVVDREFASYAPPATFTLSSTTANSSQTVTTASTAGLSIGMAVSGGNIPFGSYITSIVNGTTFTISNTTAASGEGAASLVFTLASVGVGRLNQVGYAGYSINTLNGTPLATDNIRAIASVGPLFANTTVNTFAMVNPGAAQTTVNLGGFKLTLQGGGLLLAHGGDNRNISITNGTITSGTLNVPSDLYIHALPYGGTNRTAVIDAAIVNNGTGAVRMVFSGSDGAANLTLNGTNTYTGGTVVNGGVLIIGSAGAIAGGGITINGGYQSGSGILAQQVGGTIASSNIVTLNGTGLLVLAGQQTLQGLVFNGNGGGTTPPTVTSSEGLLTIGAGGIVSNPFNPASTALLTGRVDLGTSANTVTVNTYDFDTDLDVLGAEFTNFAPTTPGLIMGGLVGSSGGFTKNGDGVLQINQSLFTGTLTVAAGNVQSGAFNGGSRFADLVLGAGTSLNLNGQQTVWGSLGGSGSVFNSVANAQTLIAGFNNKNSTFSGQINRFNDAVPNGVFLNKVGTGTMTITGTQNALSGSTGTVTISQGTLAYSGAAGKALMPTQTIQRSGTLLLDNNSITSTNVNNRLASPLTGTGTTNSLLNISGGTLRIVGNSDFNTTELLTTLTVANGGGVLDLEANENRNLKLTVTNLSGISTGGTMLLRGNFNAVGVTGDQNGFANVAVSNFPVLFTQLNNNNLTFTKSIRPDIIADYSPTGQGTAFVTRDSASLYLRPLADAEMRTTLANLSQDNFSLSSNQLINNGFNAAINSVRLLNGGGIGVSSSAGYSVEAFGLQGRWAGNLVNAGPLTEFVRTGGIMAFEGNAGITTPGLGAYSGWFYFHTIGENTNLNISSILWNVGGGLVKSGAGTLTLSARSYYYGNTIVNEGTLMLDGSNDSLGLVRPDLTATSHVAAYSNLYMNGGKVDLNGGSQMLGTLGTANALPVGGEITNSSATAAMLTVSTGSGVFGGSLTGNLGFNKSGNSDLILSNANTYTGATIVSGNTLTLRDSGTLSGTSSVSVNYSQLQWENRGLNPLDNSNPVRVAASVPLNLQGGTFTIQGGGSFDTTVAFDNVAIQRGGSIINVFPTFNAGSAVELTIGNLQRAAADHGVVNFVSNVGMGGSGNNNNARVLISAVNGAGFSATQLTNGIIGGWAVVNGNSFATYKDGVGVGELSSVVGGNVFAGGNVFPAYNGGDLSSTTTQATWNINDASNRTLTLSKSVNSLRMANGGAAQTITLGSGTAAVTLSLGVGLLTNTGQATNIVSANAGSALTSSGSELFVFVNQGTTTFNTRLTGAIDLVKSGGGTLTLGNTTANSPSNDFTGTTYVNQGTLNLNADAARIMIPGNLVINNSTVTMNTNKFNATTGQIAATSNVTLNGGATLTFANYGATTTTLASLSFNNEGGVTQPAVRFNAPTALHTLNLTAANAITVVNNNPGTTPLIAAATSNTNVVNNSLVQFSNAAPVIHVSGLSPVGLVITAQISSTGAAIAKEGSGSLALFGASTYNNGFHLKDGTLIFGINTVGTPAALASGLSGSGAIGRGTLTIGGGGPGSNPIIQAANRLAPSMNTTNLSANVIINTGTTATSLALAVGQAVVGSGVRTGAFITSINSDTNFTLSHAMNSTNAANFLRLSTVVGNAVTLAGDFTFGGDSPTWHQHYDLTLTGGVNLGGGSRTITVSSPWASGYISGQITNGVNFTKDGAGILVLTNSNNSWSGTTHIKDGILVLGSLAAGADNLVIPDGSAVIIDAGAMLDMAGRHERIGSLSGEGVVTNSHNFITGFPNLNSTLTVGGDNTSTVFSGVLTGVSNLFALVKEGSGTLTLSGALSNYSGSTTINGGMISVRVLGNGGAASGIGAASNAAANLVLNGGTLRYTGITATTDRAFTITDLGATIDASGTGALSFSSAGPTLAHTGTLARNLTLTGTSAVGLVNTFAKVIANGTAATTVVKNGTNTWALTGANTYTGATNINTGTMVLSAGSLGNTAIGVASGATFSPLAASYSAGTTAAGAAGATLTLAAGSTMNMSNNAVGTFNLQQQTTFAGNALTIGAASGAPVNMFFDIGGATTTNIDRIIVTKAVAVNASGAEITINPLNSVTRIVAAGAAGSPQFYNLISGLSFTGTAASLSSNGLIVGSQDLTGNINGTTTISGLADTTKLNVGMQVTGEGIPVGSLITAISANSVTISAAATSTLSGTDLNFANAYKLSLSPTGTALRLGVESVVANSWFWDGIGAANASWDSANNWNTLANGTGIAGVPDVVDSVFLTANTASKLATTLGANIQVGRITFTGTGTSATGTVTISGGVGADRLAIGAGGIVVLTGSGAHTINSSVNVRLASNQTWNIGNAANTPFTVDALVSDIGAGMDLTKAGTGTLKLNNVANTYRGATRITGGVLEAVALANGGVASSIGMSADDATNLVLTNNATLSYKGSGAILDRIFSIGTGGGTIESAGTGALIFNGIGAMGFDGAITARTLTLSGDYIGTGALIGAGPYIDTNTLMVAIGDSTGATSLLKMDDGTWILAPGNALVELNGVINGTTTVTADASGLVVNQLVTGAGIKPGSFVQSIGQTINLTLTGNTLAVNDKTDANGTPNPDGEYTVTSRNGDNVTLFTDRRFTMNQTSEAMAPAETVDLNIPGHGLSNGQKTDVDGTPNPEGEYTATVIDADNVSLLKPAETSRSIVFDAAAGNGYTGVTTITGGVLSVADLKNGGIASTIGASSNAAANLVINGGTLRYTGAGASTDRLFTLGAGGSGGTLDASGTGALVLTNTGDLAYTGAGTRTLTLTGSSDAALVNILAAVIADSGVDATAVTKSGANTWQLGAANTYTGVTTISKGTLRASKIAVSGGNSSLGNAASAVVLGDASNQGTLSYTGNTASYTRGFTVKAGGGRVEVATSGQTLTITSGTIDMTDNGSITFAGTGSTIISSQFTAGSGALTKEGTGSMTLTNDSNAYTGATTINGGGVFQVGVANVGRTGMGATTINTGVTLAGTGLINGTSGSWVVPDPDFPEVGFYDGTNHLVNNGAVLLPGDNGGASIGTLSFNGNLTLADGSSAFFQVSSHTKFEGGLLGAITTNLLTSNYENYRNEQVLQTGLSSWNETVIPGGAHDSIFVDGAMTLNHSLITIVDSGFVANAASGQIFDLGDWLDSGLSSFNIGVNYRNGGAGGGDLLLPTLGGSLVYDLSQFATHGIFTIITLPTEIPILNNNYNLTGGGSWNNASNWRSASVPNSTGGIANLTSNITSFADVSLDGDKVIGKVFIGDQNNTHRFNIVQGSGSGRLILDNGANGRALVSKVLSNNAGVARDVIGVPVLLRSNLDVIVGAGGAGARIDIAGSISQNSGGLGLTVMGGGGLTLSGTEANTYTGATMVFNRGFSDAGNPSLVLAKAPSLFGGVAGGTNLQLTTTAASNSATIVGDVRNLLAQGMPLSANANLVVGTVITGMSYSSLTNLTTITLSANATTDSASVATTYGSYTNTIAAQSSTATTTLNSKTVTLTNGANTNNFYVGMPVTGNSRIPAGAVVESIVNGTTFTISLPASAAGTSIATTFATDRHITTNSTAGMYVGMPVSGANIPVGSVISAITSTTRFAISQAPTTVANGTPAVFGVSVANGAIQGDLIIGGVSRGMGQVVGAGNNTAVVHLGGSEQIADTSVIRFDAAANNNTYFKMLGFNETVAGISDYTANGHIENTEGEFFNVDSTLTLNTSGTQSFNGILRDRANSNGRGVMNLVIAGNGTQILSGGGITYSGSTTIQSGATLALTNTTAFGNGIGGTVGNRTITSAGTLAFRDFTAGYTFGRLLLGGRLERTGGTANVGLTGATNFTSNVAYTAGDPLMTLPSGTTTAGLVPGMYVSGVGIPLGTRIQEILSSSTFTLTAAPTTSTPVGGDWLAYRGYVTGGVAVLNAGGTTSFSPSTYILNAGNAPTEFQVEGGNFDINGAEVLTQVSWSGRVVVQAGSLNVIGTGTIGNLQTTGARLTISGNSSVAGDVNLVGSSLLLFGTSGTIGSPTAINISGAGDTRSGQLSGLEIQNSGVGNSNRIGDAVPINLNAGRFMFLGFGSTGSENFSETVGLLTLQGGANAIYTVRSNLPTGSNTLNFAGLASSRAPGSVLVFTESALGLSTGSQVNFTSAPTLQNGIIGGWAYVGNEFATLNGTSVTALTSYSTNSFVSGVNVKINGSASALQRTVLSSVDVNSLNLQGGSAVTINPGLVLTVNTGGLLSPTTSSITGGSLTAGSVSGYDLLAHVTGAATLNINSLITNNGGNAVSLAKSGQGTLVVNPTFSRAATYTSGVNTVNMVGGATTSDMMVGALVTGAGIPAGTVIASINGASQVVLSNAPLQNGTNSSLTFTLLNSYTGKTYVNEGILQIARETDLGSNPGGFITDQLVINGGVLRVTNDMVIDDENRGITIGSAGARISVADNRTLTISSVNTINGSAGTLFLNASANNTGNLVIEGNNDLSGGIETLGASDVRTGTLASSFNSGSKFVTVATTAGLEVGSTVSGSNIPAGTKIERIVNGTTFELTAAAEATRVGQNLTYGDFNAIKLTGDNTIGLIRLLGSEMVLSGNNTLTGNIIINSGLLRIGGNNDFSGDVRMQSGELRIESANALNRSGGFGLSISSGIFNMNGNSVTLSSLSGGGIITNDGTSSAVLTVNSNADLTFNGFLYNGLSTDSPLSLVKTGLGILTLGAGNVYSGPTVIQGGGIVVSSLNSGSFASSIGSSTKAAENLVLDNGILRFVSGTASFTDRSFTMGVGDNAATIVADGTRTSAALSIGDAGFSPAVAYLGSGNRTLTLSGYNVGTNTFNLALADGAGGATSLVKNGLGTWVLGAASTFTGETRINAGILAVTVDGALGGAGGAGVVIAGGTNGSALPGGLNATFELRNVNYDTFDSIYLSGGTLAASQGISSWAGSVFAAGVSNIFVAANSSLTVKGTLGGGGSITQLGDGVLVLSGQVDTNTRNGITASNPDYNLLAGTLRLDYAATNNNNSKLADTGRLTLGGGRLGGVLQLTGGSHLETVLATTLNPGSNQVTRLTGASMLRMNAITRSTGATIKFSDNDVASTDTNNVVGILGAWATVGGSDWAIKSTTSDTGGTITAGGQDGLIRAYTAYTPSLATNDWVLTSTTGNMNVTGDNTQTARSANTLRFFTPDGVDFERRVTLHGANLLNAGGILVSSNMGSTAVLIDGSGTLTTGRQGTLVADLLVLQNNPLAALDISAVLANSPADRESRAGTTTNGSTTVTLTGIANTADLNTGMRVSGLGIAANTTITAITASTITLSTAAGPGAGAGTLSFNHDREVAVSSRAGTTDAASTTVTGIASTADLFNGMYVSGPGIAAGTRITAIAANSITLSAPANAGAGVGTLDFTTVLAGSTVVAMSNTSGLFTGMIVTGPGIARDTRITAINANASITLNTAPSTEAGVGTLSFSLPVGLDKMGVGDLILSGLNTYTGITTINAGVLTVNQLGVSGIANGTQLTSSNQSLGRTLLFGTVGGPVGLTDGLTFGQTVSGPGILTAGATITGVDRVANTVTLSSGAVVSTTAALTFGNNITARGNFSATVTGTAASSIVANINTQGLTPGQTVTGNGMLPGTIIVAILDGNRLQLSQEAQADGTLVLNFGSATLTNGSMTATTQLGTLVSVSSTLGLFIGQSVSGASIPTGATITQILDATTIQLSHAVGALGTNNLAFGNTGNIGASNIASTLALGQAVITVSSTAAMSVGQAVSGTGIPEGARVQAILSATQVRLTMPVTTSGAFDLVFAGPASNLGASRSSPSNLFFNGGILQYNGLSSMTDRGFTINTNAIWDVGNALTTLVVGGNYTTPTTPDTYALEKRGAGVLELLSTVTPGSNSYGLERIIINDGTLRVRAVTDNQYVRSDVGGLTLGGGTFELIGSPVRDTTQNMIGLFLPQEGASVIKVSNVANVNTTLRLQDVGNPEKVNFSPGSTVLFVENHNGTGNASITLAGVFGQDVQVVMPRAVYQTSIDLQNPGVNYFAFVDFNGGGYTVTASDNISIGGSAAHTIQPDVSAWSGFMNVTDGALYFDAFAGTTGTDAQVNTIRFFNSGTQVLGNSTELSDVVSNVTGTRLQVGQEIRGDNIPEGTTIVSVDAEARTIKLSNPVSLTQTNARFYVVDLAASTVNIGGALTLNGGAILQTTHAGNRQNSLMGGTITSALANSGSTSADLIIHNWNPLSPLMIGSKIVDNAALGRAVNLVHAGDGITALSGANTYTGTTFLHGGVLRLDSSSALPSNSHLRIRGGVLGLNAADFTRGLGLGASEVDWAGSGGFAAYTIDRIVNIGGGAAMLTWGGVGFVPDNDSLIFGAVDADRTLNFLNNINLGSKSRMVEVVKGVTESSIPGGRLSGVVSGTDGGVLIKAGQGALELNGGNTYAGGTSLAEGTLRGLDNGAFGSGRIDIGTTTDTRNVSSALVLEFWGYDLMNDIRIGGVNSEGVSMLINSGLGTTTLHGALTIQRSAGNNMFLVVPELAQTNIDGLISGTGGITILGGGIAEFTNSNDYGTLTGGSGPAISGATIVRSGTLAAGHNSAFGANTNVIELGDASFPVAAVDFVTSGASVLGVERNFTFDASNIHALGGVFVAGSTGLLTGSEVPQSGGPGAFYSIKAEISGHLFTAADLNKRILVKDEAEYAYRNGIYKVIKINADGTMNIVRDDDFSTTDNMRYGTQVTVTSSGSTYFMAAPTVSSVNSSSDPVYWQQDIINPIVTLQVTNPLVTEIAQAIDINPNGSGDTIITAANPVVFSGNVTLQNLQANTQETKTLTLDSTASVGTGVVFSGTISEFDGGNDPTDDVLSLLKTGTGTVTLSGANTYHGGTAVSAGTLLVSNITGSGTGSGSVTVASGAGLGGNGIIAPADGSNITIFDGDGLDDPFNPDGKLIVGNPGAAGTLGINLQAGSTLFLNGSLLMDIFARPDPLTPLIQKADMLDFGTEGVLNGALGTVDLSGSTLKVGTVGVLPDSFEVGDTWQLIDWSGLTSTGTSTINRVGTFSNLTGDYVQSADLPTLSNISLYWNISNLYTTGYITVAVPEPGRMLLLVLGLLCLGWRRRRRW